MNKILFPTEFSAHASQSFLYALELAKRYDASVTLLHAYHVPIDPEMSMNDIATKAIDELTDFANRNTPKEYEQVEVHYIAEMAAATDAILAVTEEEEMDLIVMGMKGKTNAVAAYFGSITLDVISRTDLPVFLVPSANRFKPIQKIAFAFDLKMTDLIGLEHINNFLSKLNAKITCVHFNEESEVFNRASKTINILKDLFKHHPKYKKTSFFLGTGNFESGIQDFVIEEGIDLLITQTYKRNWKFRFVEPSSSNQVARRINIPMLMIKEKSLIPVLS